MKYEEQTIEGRNAVLEAFRSGKTIDRLYVLKGCQDGPVNSILREARKRDTIVSFVTKERLDQMSETKKHQGVIAHGAVYAYAEVEDMLKLAEEKGESPFLFLLDNIEDPHNLKGGRTDGDGGQGVGRGDQLHAGGQSNQSWGHN